jgi:hypothetical protein
MPEPRHVIRVRDTVNTYNYGQFQFEALCDCGRSSLQPSLLDASEWAQQHIKGFTLETPVSKTIPDGNILMWAVPSDMPIEPPKPIPPQPPATPPVAQLTSTEMGQMYSASPGPTPPRPKSTEHKQPEPSPAIAPPSPAVLPTPGAPKPTTQPEHPEHPEHPVHPEHPEKPEKPVAPEPVKAEHKEHRRDA